MTAKRLIPTIAVAAACAVGGLPVASASAATDVAQSSSGNWSGYAVAPSSSQGAFKTVAGSWVAPSASCRTGRTYSAFWVGLGGAGSSEALEQAGTEANCSTSGTPSYYAWYELVPSAPVRVNLTVHPGDHMSSRVSVNGTEVTINLVDATTGQTFARTLHMSSPDTSSAEWIAEAPSACDQDVSQCTPLPLADFSKVTFTNATATTTSGHTGTIADPEFNTAAVTLDPGATMGYAGYDLTSQASSAGATPSSLSSGGSSFSVAYAAGSGSSSGVSSSGGGYGYSGGGYGYSGAWGYAYGGGYGSAGGLY